MTRRSACVAALLCASGASAWPTLAETKPAPSAAKAARKPPAYIPPDVGAPKTRVIAATRGGWKGPSLVLFVPEQTGLTSEASPALYWYLSDRFAGPIEVALVDDRRVDPVLSLRLERGAGAGVHALPLAEHGVVLEPGVEYEWSVSLITDPDQRSADVFASGTIRRVARAAVPTEGEDSARVATLAREGLWYDAIDLVGRLIAAHPDDATLRDTRAALLEQVGLDVPASGKPVASGGQ